jgi:dienelactone hydrolase
VLSVDFRGSTGFGRRFLDAGDGQWGRAMEDDLLDAVAWSLRHGVAQPDRVAIMGASYGGYAALAGLALFPGTFACGIDLAGPADLPAMLDAVPRSWTSYRAQMLRRVGDPSTSAGRAALQAVSPLAAVDRIARPLLVVAGANDPQVPVAESERLATALAARSAPVTALVFPREGHGLVRTADNLAFLAVAENFLVRCLGGRAQPIGDALRASDVEVRFDLAHVPGLAEAMAARGAGAGEVGTGKIGAGDAEAADAETPNSETAKPEMANSETADAETAGAKTAGAKRAGADAADAGTGDTRRGGDDAAEKGAAAKGTAAKGPAAQGTAGIAAAGNGAAGNGAAGSGTAGNGAGGSRPGDDRRQWIAPASTPQVRGTPPGSVRSIEIRVRPPQAGDGCVANQARASATSAAMPACSASRPP